jgi:hypothetical protein
MDSNILILLVVFSLNDSSLESAEERERRGKTRARLFKDNDTSSLGKREGSSCRRLEVDFV